MRQESSYTGGMLKPILILTSLTLACSLRADDAAPTKYQLLKDSRANIVYPEYNEGQKQTVLNQVRLVLEQIFTHQKVKIRDFGERSNPTPQLNSIEQRLKGLSTGQFHAEMNQVFLNLHDLHTTYSYPKPHSCYRSFLPVTLKEASIASGEKVIAVGKTVDRPEVVALLTGPIGAKVGDIVRSIDGTPVYELVERNKTISMGANVDAINTRAVESLGYVRHSGFPVLLKDSAELVIENAQGQVSTVEMPWLTSAKEDCLNPRPEAITTAPTVSANDDLVDMNRLFRTTKKSRKGPQDWIKTADETLKYRKIKNDFGEFGVIRLESFVPETLNTQKMLWEMLGLLRGPLKDTDGLILDVRDNGGGYIFLAEAMVQFFTPKDVVPLKFRMRNSAANYHYMSNTQPRDPFTLNLARISNSSAEFGSALDLNTPDSVNDLGQFYFRPVIVFNNANCYSSCDMMSALMQDNGVAEVFGEDTTTGAGGANNQKHSDITKYLRADLLGPYQVLPAGQDIGYSFRQTIRVGENQGKLIENIGVLADHQATRTVEDLRQESIHQYRQISQRLKELTPQNPSELRHLSNSIDIPLKAEGSVKLQWKNLDALEFVDQEAGVVGKTALTSDSEDYSSVALPTQLTQKPALGMLNIRGLKNDQRVARNVVYYRVVPESLILQQLTSWQMNLTAPSMDPVVVYNRNKDELGWQLVSGELKLGKEMFYGDNLDSTATLFVTLPTENDMTLNLDYEVDTEKDCDYFTVTLVTDGQTFPLVAAVSGTDKKARKISLKSYKGKAVEIRLNFNSDPSVSMAGVKITKFELVPSPPPTI